MAKKVHFIGKNGKGLCGIKSQNKNERTIISAKVTCSNCLRKMARIHNMEIRYERQKNKRT